MKNKLKINIWTGILDIINIILVACSWFVIGTTAFADAFGGTNVTNGVGDFFYLMLWIGVAINIWALIASRKHHISITGPVLGIIGSALFGCTAILALPSFIILIIAAVFTFMQRPAKSVKQ